MTNEQSVQRIPRLKVLVCAVIGGALAYYLIRGLTIGVGINGDSAAGFVQWIHMVDWIHFNQAEFVSPNDLAQQRHVFLAWFTPGQYAIPGVLSLALHSTLATGALITVCLSALSGMIGLYRLYRALGCPEDVALVSVALLAFKRHVALGFAYYHGGDTLLFGFLPWAALAFVRYQPGLLRWLGLIAIGCVGFFLKASFLVSFAALAGIGVYLRWSRQAESRWSLDCLVEGGVLTTGFQMGTAVVSTSALARTFFLSKGANPGTPSGLDADLLDIAVPLASPVTSAFDADLLLRPLVMTDRSHAGAIIHGTMVVLGLGSLVLLYWFGRRSSRMRELSLALRGSYTVVGVIMASLYLLGADVDYSSRHFHLTGLLLIPFVVERCLDAQRPRVVRVACGAMLVIMVSYGLFSHHKWERMWASKGPPGRISGFLTGRDKESNDLVYALGKQAAQAGRVVFAATNDALDLGKCRLLLDEGVEPQTNRVFAGRAGRVWLLLDRSRYPTRESRSALARAFRSYPEMRTMRETRDLILLGSD